MRPYQLQSAHVTLLGPCALPTTTREDGRDRGPGPVVSGRLIDTDDDLLLLIVIIALSLIAGSPNNQLH